MGNASLLEASRRSWKEGGAISQERYKGAQSAKSVFSWSWWKEVGWKSWSWSVEKRSVERPVRWSLQSVESPGVAQETWTGGAALIAVSREPERSCEESRRELAGTRKARAQPRLH